MTHDFFALVEVAQDDNALAEGPFGHPDAFVHRIFARTLTRFLEEHRLLSASARAGQG